MKVLFLDDDQIRIDDMKGLLPPGTKYIKTGKGAINQLSKGEEWNILFIDHDLGETGEYRTGYDVALWIAKNEPIIRKIIIHSMNPVGSNQMYMLFKNAKYNCTKVPYSILHENLRKSNDKNFSI